MTRLWTRGTPVADVVLTAEGQPVAFCWWQRQHQVQRIINAWEVQQWPDGILRDYFLVVTDTRLYLDLFRDQITADWYIQRLHD